MYFKFLNNNEDVLFNQEIINSCQIFYNDYLNAFNNHELANRQHCVPNLGTYYIIDFEYDDSERAFFGNVVFSYEILTTPKIIIRFRDDRIMSVTITHI
jgi:hypothetical protein